jgi:hypothetical protein
MYGVTVRCMQEDLHEVPCLLPKLVGQNHCMMAVQKRRVPRAIEAIDRHYIWRNPIPESPARAPNASVNPSSHAAASRSFAIGCSAPCREPHDLLLRANLSLVLQHQRVTHGREAEFYREPTVAPTRVASGIGGLPLPDATHSESRQQE